METRIGIRELKAPLSRYLQQVKEGAVIGITEHGQPIAPNATSRNLGPRRSTKPWPLLRLWAPPPFPWPR